MQLVKLKIVTRLAVGFLYSASNVPFFSFICFSCLVLLYEIHQSIRRELPIPVSDFRFRAERKTFC